MERNETELSDPELIMKQQSTIRKLKHELQINEDRNKMLNLSRLDDEEFLGSIELQMRHKRLSKIRKFISSGLEEIEPVTKKIKREEEYFEEADIKNEDEGATPDITEESEDSASVLTGLDQGAVLVANILNISEKEVKKSRPNENQEKSSLPEKDTVGEVINLVELQDQGKSSPPKKDTIGTVMNPKKLQENQGKSSPPEKDIIFVKITNDPQQHQEQTTRILNAGIQMGFLKYSLLLDKVDCLTKTNSKLEEEKNALQLRYNKQQDYLVNLERDNDDLKDDVVDIQIEVDALKKKNSDLSDKVSEMKKEKQKMSKQIEHLKKKEKRRKKSAKIQSLLSLLNVEEA